LFGFYFRGSLAALFNVGVTMGGEGVPVSLQIVPVEIPEGTSPYFDRIQSQAYRIEINPDQVSITGHSYEGMYYATRTFEQLLDGPSLPVGTIVDWPDLPIRMIMVDPARQNENMDYYRRLIEFAGRHKINAILCHLTDDQTSALYHEEYPELMHHRAWTPEEIAELKALARKHHIQLIPEVESLGHSRMFERRPNFEDYLHQTTDDSPDESWMGTDIPGYTNVLCPASPQAHVYLDRMFERAENTFGHQWIHVGFDEVDMTQCERCIAAFGEQTSEEWMITAFETVSERVQNNNAKTALWGDMLLSHPAVADAIPTDSTIIFDWHYRPDVSDESVHFFLERGFEVIASPALACAPHMVIPNRRNYDNIARFTEIARDNDLLGVNTTIWVPVRYLTDGLWTGIAFAADHAWAGSNFDEEAFFAAFSRDFFGSAEGEAHRAVWNRLVDILWHRPDIYTASWIDSETLEAARTAAKTREAELREMITELEEIRAELDRIGESVTANHTEWKALGHGAAILQYTMEHLLAAPHIDTDAALLADLNARCVRLIEVIEADWDRNRYADDPGKEGRFLQNQHLLFRFRQMDVYHKELLAKAKE
ncbi:MAG: family 20 glycosylhydrolase, partial [Candidatus Sumerlaeia bacterium]|nr:family 20 glycosylhydrolase [Candidatus Sumerlaeia bacterium]